MLPPALTTSYAQRIEPSAMPERMDGETSFELFDATLKSLASVNVVSLGYRPITGFLARYLKLRPPTEKLHIVDIGSGHGDGLRRAAEFLDKHGVAATLSGVDMNPHAAASASKIETQYTHVDIEWITADVFDYIENAPPPDIVMSSLFCHHLDSDDIPPFLSWMDRTAKKGWLINDLYRSRLASCGFFALAHLSLRHPVVRHDGPVSFARSFRRPEWQRFLSEAGVTDARIGMGAPFRLCIEKIRAP
ncbi:methyltransferase domain-containing protein [Parvularcula maris]|uniref:Methyltransferase domain-containing protein n=1 Tax=Parvularcula maris TaxID=2965077 RepID=A0A9X2L7R4_9PROT|nr:methyltransferase domain-containing protein [Parvularcula maris]MCQ8184673.1 methyltransferase domain-containing protein [Parvularcula maris]